ncbi:MAG: 23S rRNA (adenine(2030)-N(6))-methyltransferase RlmJ [Mesorhizobium sp.]|nr:MAG: 23S rRNA (adenine(2030)-N(6))-methyltransferase RlmJ [Mesorhizobium sp.]TJW42091.1 MAG: 23S rRNA (adenine(2030)-N(6))-methyltransferase RlmJ [Mesorhizobium sp.]
MSPLSAGWCWRQPSADGAHLPLKEKPGLVLVGPPFEEEGEFDRLAEGLQRAHRRWPGAVVSGQGAEETSVPKLLEVGFEIRPPSADPSLDGSGMVVVNPPFTLEGELRTLLPVLHRLLTVEKPAHWTLEWLAGE